MWLVVDPRAARYLPRRGWGAHLLNPSAGVGNQPGLVAIQASSFVKQLEEFHVLLVEAQNTFAKKLGSDVVEPVAGAKKGVSG